MGSFPVMMSAAYKTIEDLRLQLSSIIEKYEKQQDLILHLTRSVKIVPKVNENLRMISTIWNFAFGSQLWPSENLNWINIGNYQLKFQKKRKRTISS